MNTPLSCKKQIQSMKKSPYYKNTNKKKFLSTYDLSNYVTIKTSERECCLRTN